MYISIKNIRLASSEPMNKGSSPAASWQENKELGTMAVGALRRSVVTTWETVGGSTRRVQPPGIAV